MTSPRSSPARRRLVTAARTAAWSVLLGTSGLLIAAEVSGREAPEGVDIYRDIVYRRAGGREVRLDVYVPRGKAPARGRRTILAIHGGAWFGGSKDGYGRASARLAQHGYVVVSAAYRLSRRGAPSWPDNFEDVREAVRWTRRHASDYGIDPDRIAAMGASAGGHLASLLGTYPDGPVSPEGLPDAPARPLDPSEPSARVGAVIDFYGPTDLKAILRGNDGVGGPLDLFLGGTPKAVPGRYLAASPLSHVSKDDPPHLLIHGMLDRIVPLDQSERLASALREAGVRQRTIVIDRAGHGFGLRVGERDLVPDILAFLDETWDHKGDSP